MNFRPRLLCPEKRSGHRMVALVARLGRVARVSELTAYTWLYICQNYLGDSQLLLQTSQNLLPLRVRADSLTLVLLNVVLCLGDHELQALYLAVVVE